MGVSGGEEGARNGPALMPGGERQAYGYVDTILQKVAAQVGEPGGDETWERFTGTSRPG